MASKEELSEQLSLMTKLASQVERMAVAAEKLEQSYSNQIDAVQKLAAAINAINVGGTVQSIEALNKSLSQMQGQMKDTGKTSETTFSKLGQKVTETGKTIGQKFPKEVAVGVAALTGFAQGVRNVIAMTKSVTSFFATFVDGLANVAVSIIAIPFKMFQGLIDLAAKAGGGMNELAEAIEKLRKEFGALYGPTNKAIVTTAENLTGFKDTGLSAWRVFGTLAERLNYIRELATEMGGAFGKLRKEMEENGGAILAYQKGLGIANEDMKGVTRNATAMGKKTSDSLKEMTKQSYALGNAFELDAKLISRDMSKALTDVKHFGGATVKQIAEASTYARKLGFELKDITGTLDQFDTFDTAAENAAKLSQAFGVNIDAFELMKAQSPAEQLELLRKSFRSAGVDASKFDRASLKLAATTTGLNEDVVQSALSMKNQGMRLDEIKKKSGEAEKKTMTQAQAMAQLSDAIERLVKSGGSQTGSFWDMFVKGFLGGIQQSKEFQTIIWNIKRALQETYMQGVRLGRAFVEIFPGAKQFLGAIGNFFDPKKFRVMVGGVVDILEDWMKSLSKPGGAVSFPTLMEKIQKNFFNFFNKETPEGKEMLSGFKTFLMTFTKIAAEGIKWASDKIADGIRFVTDILTGKRTVEGAADATAGGLGFMGKIIVPMIEALKHAGKTIGPALWDLVKVLGHKLMELLKSKEFQELIRPAIPYIAAALFGPALTRAILGSLTTNLLKSMLSGGGLSTITRALGSLTTRLGGSALGQAAGAAAGPAAAVAAALAVGRGVTKYTETITSTLDHSEAVIAAGATGLIDALTLGLLPPNLTQIIANTLGSVVSMIYAGIGKVFGSGFATAMKRHLGAQFELFGSIWNVLGELFNGDQASFDKAAEELKMAGLRFIVTFVEYMFVQLPLLFDRLAIKILSVVANLVIRLTVSSLGLITQGIDKVFGTSFTEKMRGLSDSLTKGINSLGDKAAEDLKQKSSQVSELSGKLQDQYLRTADDQAKIAKQKAAAAAKATTSAQADATNDAVKETQASIDTVSHNIRIVKDIQKELTTKGFDLPKAIASLHEQLKGIDFKFIDDNQIQSLDVSAKNISKFSTVMEGMTTALGYVSTFPQAAKKAAEAIKKDSAKAALDAVKDMVKVANDLDSALSDGALNKIDVKTKLQNVARAVGLGGKATYTVNPSKEVQITVNLHVTMDAGEVERVIIERSQSIIRDRINFATNTPTERGNSQISDTFGATPKEIGSAGTKT